LDGKDKMQCLKHSHKKMITRVIPESTLYLLMLTKWNISKWIMKIMKKKGINSSKYPTVDIDTKP
jgi:hypothetical protein